MRLMTVSDWARVHADSGFNPALEKLDGVRQLRVDELKRYWYLVLRYQKPRSTMALCCMICGSASGRCSCPRMPRAQAFVYPDVGKGWADA